jgi:hypothetical protein
MDLFFDRQGRPLSVAEFEEMYVGPDREKNIVIARDQICHVRISTVWLGVDYGAGLFGGPRMLFETMTFSTDEEWDSRLIARYATEGAAMAGHLVACWAVRSMLRQLAP